MIEQIEAMGADHGDPGGCVVCHGGDPAAPRRKQAHQGSPGRSGRGGWPGHASSRIPARVWIADKTCGQCHAGYAERLTKSLMNTEAGKLQGNLWSWGVQKDHKVIWGNYDPDR